MEDIKGYEGLYAITEDGQIWSYRSNRFIKSFLRENGYLQAILVKDGIKKAYKIHRLVAITYIPNPYNYPEVNHKDEDRTNNNINNLEWCPHDYNCNYGERLNRISTSNTKRFNIYADNELKQKILKEAKERNITTEILLLDIVNSYFNLKGEI